MSGGRRHAFKLLLQEKLVTSVMGKKGATKDRIQDDTGCKLVLSNRDEYYPGTQLRTLVVFGETEQAIVPVLDAVIEFILEHGAAEANSLRMGEGETHLGKEPGEYVVRLAISQKMSGGIIGNGGSNIQHLRQECGAKVFIDNNRCQGHQLVRVIAPPDGLRHALVRINEIVQQEGADSDWFTEWASVRTFDGSTGDYKGDSGKGDRGDRKGDWKADRKGESKGGSDWRGNGKGDWKGEIKGSGKSEWKGKNERPRSPRRRSRSPRQAKEEPEEFQEGNHPDLPEEEFHDSAVESQPGPEYSSTEHLQILAGVIAELPRCILNTEQTLTCDMPREKVSALIGARGANIKEIRAATGAYIHFEEVANPEDQHQTLILRGHPMKVYQAHSMMMKKYHDEELAAIAAAEIPPEPEPTSVAGPPTVDDLQRQLAELQKQLNAVQGNSFTGPPKGTGKIRFVGGKSKGKGKKGR